MVTLPRLVVAAPSTGSGKTTIATGLMAALRASGHEVSGHKVGPDYIDPGYHALATGRPGRNLDPHLVGESRVVPLLLHGAAGADVAVIEGVMGLYDGRLGTSGFASTAHVAALTSSPVVLVLDVARMSRSAAAIAAGMAVFDPSVRIGGVVLNRCRPGRNADEITGALEQHGLPVLGMLPPDETLATPSRHLGLVPVDERAESVALIERLGEQVAAHLDLAALLDVARSAPGLEGDAWDPVLALRGDDCVGFETASFVPHDAGSTDGATPVGQAAPVGRAASASERVETNTVEDQSDRPVIAVAGGRAFTFRYPETEELLEAAGCDLHPFDPLTDPALPEGTSGIYLGGGFPEMYAAELAANRSLLADLRTAVEAGIPTVAECAGLLYLAESLDGTPMAGALPAHAAMSERLTLRYPVATAASDSLLTRAGEEVTGHEFHRTATSPAAGTEAAWTVDGAPTGFSSDTVHAAYLHVHWAGYPHLARRFADAARSFAPVGRAASASERVETNTVLSSATVDRVGLDTPPPSGSGGSTSGVADPLRHHGDVEVGKGLLDFAVNVYPGERPSWLDEALHESLASTAYPDEEPARAALAKHHGRERAEVLPTAGAAEAFTLVARARPWRKPVVVHPQFTEPHAALEQAGHSVTEVRLSARDGFALDPAAVPDDADLVVVGNPTNPTGVLHPAASLRALVRPGRLVVVDEAFMDAVPGEPETLTTTRDDGLLVIRSLTKHWSIPGVRAGYVVGDPAAVGDLEAVRTPWSVSSTATAAMLACATERASAEARERAERIVAWRDHLEAGLRAQQIEHVPSTASFVLARPGAGVRELLRDEGVAVRRADTFPGLDPEWVRIAVRPPEKTDRLLSALSRCKR
ncbi:hydrogenobyrinic acid a,c-diamide synthase (glutamine-hydrolysing) /cobyrinate a,c-diamide synthase [Nocardioides albertanoniae]|uniref:Hydrogenobyrinate a,c-diamide synthase n=1 Tax=Nocardioides albertanoniae TaxID=1175486 RepID=A0A543A4U7_9ACTN|nr:cobyrinate a,c-diamide synthase [Nocardioides albertanoniae]TQL67622.1 hydrogenobyrinic acid a,c-diamide synthase (glutamine-hydrolysing) /cobyrinate a,c-diamide synthase [Nocardioides albertanoniae]